MILRIVSVITLLSFLVAAAAVYLVSVFADFNPSRLLLSFVLALPPQALILYAVFERRAPVFGRVFWKGPRDARTIALTFDDGPNEPYTSRVLDILKSFNVKATFFILGENARVFPDAVRRAAGEGHEIGNHGCDHSVLPLKSPGRIRKEIRTTNDLIEGIAGVRPKLFRASHGWRNPWVNKAARENGCLPVAWTHGVWDTDMPGSGVIAARASKGLRNGCVLLLHDGRGTEHGVNTSQLIEALPTIIELACQSGYGFVTVSEMMKGTCT